MMSSGIYKKNQNTEFVGLQTSETLASVASVSALHCSSPRELEGNKKTFEQ